MVNVLLDLYHTKHPDLVLHYQKKKNNIAKSTLLELKNISGHHYSAPRTQ